MPSPKYNVNSDSFSSTSLPFSRLHKKSTFKLYKPNKKTGIYYQQTSSKEKVYPKQWIIRIVFFLLISYFIIQYISSPNTNQLATEYIPELTIAQKYQPVLSPSSALSSHHPKPYLTLHQVDLVPEIFGQPISHFAHQADIIRLDVLNEYGGIYLDMDVISLKPLDDY
ncbi:unnamed protein product [Cunninghamella echinulata]